MATEKTRSYLSSIKEASKETNILLNKSETQRAIKLAFRKDFEGALDISRELENEEMVFIFNKCIELQPIFIQFLSGEISLAQYKRKLRKYPDEVKEIVHYKYPNLEFIELKNLERKFREKIEAIIDDLLSKNTLESLIEARKVYEKNIGVVKKPYNFDKLFVKTISFIPYSELAPLYDIEWSDVDVLINTYLLDESKSFAKSEAIIKTIKIIDKNRDVVQAIIRSFNKTFDARLRQNYNEVKLKNFVREYNKHSFYFLDRHNKVDTKVEPFFLQRRIYSTFYLNENCELFLGLLKTNIDCMNVIPNESQKAFYHAIIRSVRKTADYSIFEYIPEKIINSQNFIDVIRDLLEEDENTIRKIVEQLKGKENQLILENLFLNIFKKELSFVDTKKAPEFNKEKAEVQIHQYKENDAMLHKTKANKLFYRTIAALELILTALAAAAINGICVFAFRRELYFVGAVVLIITLAVGVYSFIRLADLITIRREKRLLSANKIINELEKENNIILKKIFLGID